MYRLTDTIAGDAPVEIELDDLRATLIGWLPDPTEEMLGVMDILVGKLAAGENVDGECAYLGISVEKV